MNYFRIEYEIDYGETVQTECRTFIEGFLLYGLKEVFKIKRLLNCKVINNQTGHTYSFVKGKGWKETRKPNQSENIYEMIAKDIENNNRLNPYGVIKNAIESPTSLKEGKPLLFETFKMPKILLKKS